MPATSFRSWRSSKLLPADAATAPGAPVQTQATTVFAFHYAEGVLMAGDRRATAGNVIVTDRVEKIIEMDSDFAAGHRRACPRRLLKWRACCKPPLSITAAASCSR